MTSIQMWQEHCCALQRHLFSIGRRAFRRVHEIPANQNRPDDRTAASSSPLVETRNRKPMRPNPLASWELRIEDVRVFYDVAEEPEPTVSIIAIGTKEHGRLIIGGEEFQL